MLVLTIPPSSAKRVQRAETRWRARSEPAAQLAARVCSRLRSGPVPLQELEDELWDEETEAADEEAALFGYVLKSLVRDGLAEVEIVDRHTPLARVQRALPEPRTASRAQALKLSRLASLRPLDGKLIVETSLHPGCVMLLAELGVLVCARLAQGMTPAELDALPSIGLQETTVDELVGALAAIEALAPTTTAEPVALSQWEPHDALFHARTRGGRTYFTQGATYRFADQRPPEGAIPKRSFAGALELPAAPLGPEAAALQALMQRRCSIRSYGRQAIRAVDLGALLRMVARNKAFVPANPADPYSYDALRRPYPGAGGMHELHIYPVVHRCEGLGRGVYCYDGSVDRLLTVAPMNPAGEQLLRDAARSMAQSEPPDILLCIAARFGRLNWKYEGIAYSLILKNVGVLFQTLYLAATALRLAPCALGRGDTEPFLRATGNHPFEEESVGEFAIGSSAEAEVQSSAR